MSSATASSLSLASPAVAEGKKETPRLHPFRRLRIDRWTVTHAIAATVMGVVAVFATWDAWFDIFDKAYRETEYSHIFLVPVVTIWMVYARRHRIRYCKPIGCSIGVTVALLGWAVHTFGYYKGFQTLWHGGAVLVLIGCVLSVLGKHALFRFFPAIAVLVFLIPVPQHWRLEIAQPLQGWTAEVSQTLLQLLGVEVMRAGDQLSVNGKPVQIIEACNGLRMVFALVLVSYAFSFGLPLRNWVRVVLLIASPVSAIICNIVRIVPTALVHGTYGAEAGNKFHDYSVWVMLPVSFLILLAVIRILRWAMVPVMKFSLVT